MPPSELLAEVRNLLARMPSISELPAEAQGMILDAVGKKFVRDVGQRWWWTSLACDTETFSYGARDGIAYLSRLVEPDVLAHLVITDDQSPPWPVFSGPFGQVCQLLRGLPFFEYFITDTTCDWIVFDTHHNSLVVGGTLVTAARSKLPIDAGDVPSTSWS